MRKLLLTAALIGLAGCATETEEEQLSCNADGLRDILVSEETDAKSKAIANVPDRTISTSEIEAARNALEAAQNARNEFTEARDYHEFQVNQINVQIELVVQQMKLEAPPVYPPPEYKASFGRNFCFRNSESCEWKNDEQKNRWFAGLDRYNELHRERDRLEGAHRERWGGEDWRSWESLNAVTEELNDLTARRDLRGRRVQWAQRRYEEFIASQYDFKDVVTKESLNEGATNYIICDGALEKVSGDFTGREQITGDWTWRHEKTVEGESIFTRLRGRNKQAELK